MPAAEPEQAAGDLDEPQGILGLLLPADQEAATLMEPGQRAFYYPPARGIALGTRRAGSARRWEVRLVVPLDRRLPAGRGVVAAVQRQMRLQVGGRLGPCDDGRSEGVGQPVRVGHLGPGEHYGQRPALAFDEEALLPAGLRAIGRVRAHQVPPFRALLVIVSAACHSQSTPPRSSLASWIMAQSRSNTPRASHRWKVRCTELSSGNSAGRWFHWTPVRSR